MQKEKPTTKQSETVGTFSSHAETEVFLVTNYHTLQA